MYSMYHEAPKSFEISAKKFGQTKKSWEKSRKSGNRLLFTIRLPQQKISAKSRADLPQRSWSCLSVRMEARRDQPRYAARIMSYPVETPRSAMLVNEYVYFVSLSFQTPLLGVASTPCLSVHFVATSLKERLVTSYRCSLQRYDILCVSLFRPLAFAA